MDLTEIVRTLWRRRVTVVISLVVIMASTIFFLKSQTVLYKSTATVALIPVNQDTAIYILSQVSTVAPVYGEAANSAATLTAVKARLGQTHVARIEVRTFDSPVLKIDAISPNPLIAQASAQAVTDVLVERADRREVGIPQLRLLLIQSARLPSTPFSPQTKLTLIFGVVVAVFFAVAMALLRERLAPGLETAERAIDVTGQPVWAEVPYTRAVKRMVSPEDLLVKPSMRVVAEAIRDLRTNLQLSESRALLLTSPVGRHGKTTVSFALALMFARAGVRTVVVDADLRRGRLETLFDEGREPGLTEVLQGKEDLRNVLRSIESDLSLIAAGGEVSDPPDLLEREFASLLHRLEKEFQIVVVDGPPLMPMSDARIVAKSTDLTILVVDARRTSVRRLRAATQRLRTISLPIDAVVLNGVRRAARGSGAYLK